MMRTIIMNHTNFGPPYAVFNLSKVGLRYFRIGINASKSSRDALAKYFTGHPNVGWIFFAEGWFNIAIGLWVKDNAEISDISSQIRNVLSQDDEIVFQSELTSLCCFGNRPVTGVGEPMYIVDATTYSIELSPLEIDYIKLIAIDSSFSCEDFGKILGITAETVSALQKKLTDNGIIVGYQDRIDYGGLHCKVFIDSLKKKSDDAVEDLIKMLWKDRMCLYFERANSKYDIEFEVVINDTADIDKYLGGFSEYKISFLTKNIYTNLYPLNKIANLKEISEAVASQQGSVIDLRNSKLWYLNYKSAEAYLRVYENKNYFEAMEKSELDLLDEVIAFIRNKYPNDIFSVTDIGSGNGLKGRIFIEKLGEKFVKAYYPIDIQPIELAVALRAHTDGKYAKHPTLLDFKNLSARFPLRMLPNEKQVHLFFGGTYGNFQRSIINNYLKPLADSSGLLFISMPLVEKTKTDKEIINLYANIDVENIAFGPLAQIGFTKDDFEQNPDYPHLKVQIAIENRRNICSLILKRDVEISRRIFSRGTTFKMTTSWKPTLEEFRTALEKDFIIEKIVHNQDMATAIIERARES